MKVVYYSLTGQTRRFVKKLELTDAIEIKRQDPLLLMTEDFVLITPTYEDGLDFLDQFVTANQAHLKGVIGSGNRNFGPDFCHVAKRYAKTFQVPVLYELEFNGTDEDVKNVKGMLNHGS